MRRDTSLLDVRGVVLPFLVSRVLSVAVIVGAFSWPFSDGLSFDGFARWDGGYFLGIAAHGYGAAPVAGEFSRWPFFPLFSLVLRGFDTVGISPKLGGALLNEAVFLVALAGLYRLAARHCSGATAARLAVWSLALFPASFVFSMLYPSSILLAGSVWAFLFVEDRRDGWASVLVVACTLVRPNGFVVAVALVVALRSGRRALVVAGPSGAALGVWFLLCWRWAGDPIVFWTTKGAWEEISLVDAFTGGAKWSILPHVVLALAAVGAVVWERRRLPVSWLAYTGLYVLPGFVTGMVGLGRYANECFPPFVAAGNIAERFPVWARAALFVVSAAGLVAFGSVVMRAELVP